MPLKFNPTNGKLDLVSDLSTLPTTYLKLDCSNDPLTNDLAFSNTVARLLSIEPSAETTVGRALTLNAGSTIAGATTNVAGGNLILNSGLGKGTGASSIIFQTGRTLGSGATLQTLTTAMTILGGGNVGIGTTSPGYALDVSGSIGLSGNIQGAAGTSFYMGSKARISADTNGKFGFNYNTGATLDALQFFAGGTSQVWGVDHSGNTTQTGTLVVSGTGNNSIAGNLGIGTTAPTRILGIGGLVARNIGMERGTVANTAGFALTLNAGGATVGATDKAGGDLILSPGLSTGSAESGVQINGCVAGVSGTADRTITKAIQVLGNKLAFFNGTPIIQQTLSAYTSDGEGSAYTGIDNLQAGTPYATVADLNQLRVAYETLRASYDDLKTKLQATTLIL